MWNMNPKNGGQKGMPIWPMILLIAFMMLMAELMARMPENTEDGQGGEAGIGDEVSASPDIQPPVEISDAAQESLLPPVTFEGAYEAVPYVGTFLALGDSPGTAIFTVKDGGTVLYVLADYRTGEWLRTEAGFGDVSSSGENSRWAVGDGIVLKKSRQLMALDRSLNVVTPPLTIPDWLFERGYEEPYWDHNHVRISPDGTRFTLRDDAGIHIYDIVEGTDTLVPGTERTYGEDGSIYGGEAYKIAHFVMGGRKLFCQRYGWEWGAGYLLYDLDTGESNFYKFYSVYLQMMGDGGAYIFAYPDEKAGEGGSVYIDFDTGEMREAPEAWATFFEWELCYPAAPDRYLPIRAAEGISSAEEMLQAEQLTYRVDMIDSRTGARWDTGCRIVSGSGWGYDMNATEEGGLYLVAGQGDRRMAFLVA